MSNRRGGSRQTLNIDEVADILGISRASAYKAVNSGLIPVVRIGKRMLMPKVRLDRFLSTGEWT
jgi:excisionase family DNA binding protein